MKRTVLFTLLCLTLAPGMVWADTIHGTTNPNSFAQDFINWCQFGCVGTAFPSPQPWVSGHGATGTIGLINGGFQGFYSFKQGTTLGTTWVGNFHSGMGVIYNGFVFLGQQADIRITFNSAVEGVGAFIQGTDSGPFKATITLLDQIGNPLGHFTADGVSNTVPGTALFIGAYDDVGPIFFGAQFDVTDSAGNDDFAIGTLRSGPFIVPEPSSLLLFASSALGVAGVIRRRSRGVL